MITQQDFNNSPLTCPTGILSRKGRGKKEESPTGMMCPAESQKGAHQGRGPADCNPSPLAGEGGRSPDEGAICGFALIELLVVVLIIGILAAVALPQYQKAVRKARIAEAKVLLKAIGDAGEVYCLANDCTNYFPAIEDFDISIPAETKNWNLWLEEADQGGMWYYAEPTFETGYLIAYVDNNYGGGSETDYNGRFICNAYNEQGHKICASLGTKFEDTRYHID